MKDRLIERLEDIKTRGNYRQVRYLKPLSATRIAYEGREYLNLCSNSYLSLHMHPKVIAAAEQAARDYGTGTCSSRSVSGSIDLYEPLERECAEYKGYRKGLVFTNGYMANIAVISTLTEEGDVIFSDELNHSSLIDSMRLSRAKKVVYRHKDMSDLEEKLRGENVGGSRFVVTESVFSMDGDMAPLDDLVALKKKYGFQTILDDAHATGIFGKSGTGAEEAFGLRAAVDIQMATFGKALGSFGAVVLADEVIIDYLVNRARTFMYTTALPAPVLGAALEALRLIAKDTGFKDELWDSIDYMRAELSGAGFDLRDSMGPIIPIVVGRDDRTIAMQEMLLEKGLFLQAIRPPTVPEGTSRLRFTVVRGFSHEEMDFAVEALKDAGRKMGLI